MKVDVKKIDNLKRELNFEVPKDRVQSALEEVFKDIGKEAKIKGFRPGKAPRHILEAQYGKIAQEEAIKKIIPEAYQEGIIQQKITPMDLPEIEDVQMKEGVLHFKAKLDIKPEFTVKKYKGIKIKRKSSKVTDDEINKTLEFFKKGQGKDKEEIKLDDDFARSHGYPAFEDFKSTLVRQLEMDKDRYNRMDIENQVAEYLLKNTKLSAPKSVVDRQIEYRTQEMLKRLKSQGMPDAEIDKKKPDIKKDLEQSVEKDIKLFLIFEKIADMEKIEVKEGKQLPMKVIEFLLKEAQWEEIKK